uniref:Uncharacterized protein n=1 Tax=Knipowitschia caucasica TaxID=637954 RepID=A0AAV2LDE2_KNICA
MGLEQTGCGFEPGHEQDFSGDSLPKYLHEEKEEGGGGRLERNGLILNVSKTKSKTKSKNKEMIISFTGPSGPQTGLGVHLDRRPDWESTWTADRIGSPPRPQTRLGVHLDHRPDWESTWTTDQTGSPPGPQTGLGVHLDRRPDWEST